MYFGYNPNLSSPVFTFTPALNANEKKNYNFLFKDTVTEPASKYSPFNSLFIQNFSSSQVKVYIKSATYVISPSSVLYLNRNDIDYFYEFSVENVGNNNIAAGELLITIKREGIGTNDVIQEIIKRLSREG